MSHMNLRFAGRKTAQNQLFVDLQWFQQFTDQIHQIAGTDRAVDAIDMHFIDTAAIPDDPSEQTELHQLDTLNGTHFAWHINDVDYVLFVPAEIDFDGAQMQLSRPCVVVPRRMVCPPDNDCECLKDNPAAYWLCRNGNTYSSTNAYNNLVSQTDIRIFNEVSFLDVNGESLEQYSELLYYLARGWGEGTCVPTVGIC